MMKNKITPEVGMGVTQGVGSDSYPYTIVEVLSPRRVVVQADSFKALPGSDPFGYQKYEYFRNPNAPRPQSAFVRTAAGTLLDVLLIIGAVSSLVIAGITVTRTFNNAPDGIG